MEFIKVTKEHILQGIKDFKEKGFPNGFGPSSTYDIAHKGENYPPKAIMVYANFHAEERTIEPYFKGGIGTDCFKALEREGFVIIPKTDPVKALIEKYKIHIAKTQLKDELYKWEFVKDYKGRPNLNEVDFYQEIKSVKFTNLIYAMAKACINHLIREKPEEVRQLFIQLFDESIDLTKRVTFFNKETLNMYRDLGQTLSHHQDERTIATYLTLHNPEKYTFYKSSFYKKYCKLLGVAPAKKNKKYTHYLSLVDELIEKYIVPDTALIRQVKSLIPDFYDGVHHKLLAQDILYQMLEKKIVPDYWVFQGNPKIFDFETGLRDEIITDWTINAHKNKIKVGDKVILWITGPKSGCYALAEITSDPVPILVSKDDHLWKEEDKSAFKAGIKITHNLVDKPLLKEDIETIAVLNNLKVGHQGTNFSATDVEYNALLNFKEMKDVKYWLYAPGRNAEHWDAYYTQNLIAIGWDEIGDIRQYKTKDAVADALRVANGGEGSEKNNATANFEFANAMQIGDVVIVKKGRSMLLGYGIVTSDYFFDDKRDRYKSCRRIDWKEKGSWDLEHSLALKTLTDITKYKSVHEQNEFYYQDLMNLMKGEISNTVSSKKKFIPLNQILYGPPGTGKTYYLKDKLFSKYTSQQTAVSKESYFDTVVSDCSWWQVIAIALLELKKAKVTTIFESKWIQKKVSLSNANTIRPILWGQLQSHTINECEFVNVTSRQQPLLFNKTQDSYWEVLEEEVKELAPELYEIKDSIDNYNPDSDKQIKNYEFVTFHQSYSYEDFIEGIKPIINTDVSKEDSSIGYQIEDGVFKRLCLKAAKNPTAHYAIFIDEINRGNVSAIFGELITLIEQDKRQGQANELGVMLPYSKSHFTVPSNIDIYGTMNTADRSVEALDTALRRRFSFLEMMPDEELLLEEKVLNISLKEILSTINNRIEILIDRDHTIGHSYFMGVTTASNLTAAFKDKIVPLLQEYFYGDYGKIGLVLGKGFVKSHKRSDKPFANFKYEGKEELNRDFYDLVAIDKDFDIKNAVEKLLNTTQDN